MTTLPTPVETLTQRAGRMLQSLAVLILLACVVGRLFVGGPPTLEPVLSVATALSDSSEPTIDINEPMRVTFALVLLATVGVWLTGQALTGGMAIRQRWLAALMGVFVGVSLLSALQAADKRAVMVVWIEQSSLMAACWLAVQVFADRRHMGLLLAVAAAAGATLCLKGFNQALYEIPVMQAAREELFGRPETVFDRLHAARVAAAKPTGFFSLSNAFGSVLILLMASLAALTANRLRTGLQAMKAPSAVRGQIPLPLVQGVCAAAALLGSAVMLVMTGSAGAVAAGCVAAMCAVVLAIFGRRLRRHWRKAVVVACVLTVLAGGAVVAIGVRSDGLPGKTMTVRWHYWTASAKIVAERPLLGVGGGNFPDAYLRHRRAEAEEAVQAPHNILVHAMTQFGLLGGALYLAVIVTGLITVCRPQRTDPSPPAGRGISWLPAAVILGGAAALLRTIDSGPWDNDALVLLEVVLPTAAFLIAFVLVGRRGVVDAQIRVVRIAIGCGLGGFALHSMVSFGPWMPGPAALFWVLLGAAVGLTGGEPSPVRRWRWLVVAMMLAVIAVMGWVIARPVWAKTCAARRAGSAIRNRDWSEATARLSAAVMADARDGSLAAEQAKLHLHVAQRAPVAERAQHLVAALSAADLAIKRCSTRSDYHWLSATISGRLAASSAGQDRAGHLADAASKSVHAVSLDPMDARLRMKCAEALLAAGMNAEAVEQLDAAKDVDGRLSADSLFRLTADERAHQDDLRQRAD